MDQAISPKTLLQRRRKTLLLGLLSLAALVTSAWALNRQIRPRVALSEVRVAEVQRGAIANTVNASGLVIPSKEEQVTSPIATRVTRVHVKVGQPVAAGELLLSLDNQTVQLAIDSLREQLGQQDNKLAVLSLELDQKHKQITSSIERWTRSAQRPGALGPTRSSGQRHDLQNELLAAELAVQRRISAVGSVVADTRHHPEPDRRQLSVEDHPAKAVRPAAALLAQTQIRAPFAGMLTWLLADEGASVTNGQLVARVSERHNFGVEASLSDFHARALAAGQAVRVEHAGQTLAGTVQTVLPEIQNGTVKLLVRLEQPSHPLLRHKLRVDVNIVTESKADTLVAAHGPAFNGRGCQGIFSSRRRRSARRHRERRQAVEIFRARAGERLST
jgi:HlyD family secretion protein